MNSNDLKNLAIKRMPDCHGHENEFRIVTREKGFTVSAGIGSYDRALEVALRLDATLDYPDGALDTI